MAAGNGSSCNNALLCAPWANFILDDQLYLIKATFTATEYQILLTNFITCWSEKLDGEDLKRRCQKLNPSVEAPLAKLLEHLSTTISEQKTSAKYDIAFKHVDRDISEDEMVQLTVRSQLAGLPFLWKFRGDQQPPQTLAAALTLPSLSMSAELLRRQSALIQLLAAKDREIEDFRGQGHSVTRRFLETSVFDEKAFLNSMATSKEFEHQVCLGGRQVFEASGRTLYRDIQRKEHQLLEADPNDGPSLFSSVAVPKGAFPSWATRLPPSLSPNRTPDSSPRKTPSKSPAKSPGTPSKALPVTSVTEQQRRDVLERKLADEEARKAVKPKKKKLKL